MRSDSSDASNSKEMQPRLEPTLTMKLWVNQNADSPHGSPIPIKLKLSKEPCCISADSPSVCSPFGHPMGSAPPVVPVTETTMKSAAVVIVVETPSAEVLKETPPPPCRRRRWRSPTW
ncbi:hypothetical protein BV898_01763 [Hypsibius exemplaris]|uniref:Uncharacterized protein n=1 Tax=Hypsibius exemplaris TaxID=2072580 RepID=A0A1W0X9K4_HYPEX|nr:hypothetical protein BV898_01763 [Hypsibius exemplaris]